MRVNPDRVETRATHVASGERLVLWVLRLTYGSFYFCRTNLGVALPGISANSVLPNGDS